MLAIGDELVHGHSTDTNSGEIAAAMGHLGFRVGRSTVVGDEPAALGAALAEACARSAVVVATGGLGPTEDDRTRDVVAALLGGDLEFHEPAWNDLVARWRARLNDRPIPDSNRRQAMIPAGLEVLQNPLGTAPGFCGQMPGGAVLFVLPGVPREMRHMLEHEVIPRALDLGRGLLPVALHTLAVLGPSEAELGELLASDMRAGGEPLVGITAKDGLLIVRVLARGDDPADAAERARAKADLLRPKLGGWHVGGGAGDAGVQLERLVGQELLADPTAPITCATAESCTGGLVAAALTDVAGISAAFLGGLVTYSNEAKERDLGVSQELLTGHGAVSGQVAEAMVQGLCARTGARLGVSITGVAGPGGGTPDKPVGTVWFATSMDGRVRSWRRDLPDLGRRWIRHRACREALVGLLKAARG